MAHTDTWRTGDVVCRGEGSFYATGKAVELKRHSDDKRFVMVRVVSGAGRIGNREWPDVWVLGAGRLSERCSECGYSFRTDSGREVLCPACDRPVEHQDAESRTSTHLRLRGTATRTEGPVPAAAPTTDEKFWTPFS